MRYNPDWEPVDGNEKILRNKISGRIIEFTDDVDAPEQELPILGLIEVFAEEDIPDLLKRWTKYELYSGGA